MGSGNGRGKGDYNWRGLVMAALEDDACTNAIKRQRLSAEQDNHSSTASMSGLPKVNPQLSSLEKDFLYHIGYDSHQCKETFKDVKVGRSLAFTGLYSSSRLVSYTEKKQ